MDARAFFEKYRTVKLFRLVKQIFTEHLEKMTSVFSLSEMQRNLTRYGMTTYITLGSIGSIFNMIIFTQSKHRRVPCSLYISAIAFCSLIGMHTALLPNVYALDHSNPLTTSLIFCQLQFYLVHLFNQSMRTLIVLACACPCKIKLYHLRSNCFTSNRNDFDVIK